MKKVSKELSENLKGFQSISLPELNSTASFLKRIDKKYLLTTKEFSKILDSLKENFKVLEIGGKKVFSYDNIYMDTDDYLFYNQHQNKEKNRTKVRTRYYVDSNTAFFEYKQKQHGITNKFRYEFPSEEHGFMTRGKKRFFDGVWQSMYGEKESPNISPSIKTNYNRITMVSNNGEERLTIDFNIKTIDLRNKNGKVVDLKNLVIIESKSLKKDCEACKIMKKYKIKKAKTCSKYSLGVVYSGLATKYDTFNDTIEKIQEIRMEMVKSKKREAHIEKIAKKIGTKTKIEA